jgi:hypothetical protein
MDKPPSTVDKVFAEPMELPPGIARDRWLAQRQAAIRKSGGVGLAADIIERAISQDG